MRIGLIAPPYLPIPPVEYGGIERVIALLVRGLRARGHEVSLLAHPDSTVDCDLVAYRLKDAASWSRRALEVVQGQRFASSAAALGLDLVHGFGRLAALLPLAVRRSLPQLQSYQRAVARRNVALAARIGGRSIGFTSCSDHNRRAVSDVGRWWTVPNGVETDSYRFRERVGQDAPLAWLGRIEPIKGTHTAIEVALRSGRDLIIAGNISPEGEGRDYFRREIEPRLGRSGVSYVGPVDDRRKNEILSQAAAMLFPIAWDEPFGIVQVEALASGTPVIAFARGAVPEVIRDGVTGFCVHDVESMVAAVGRLGELSRERCRREAERRFGADVVVESYLDVYRQLSA